MVCRSKPNQVEKKRARAKKKKKVAVTESQRKKIKNFKKLNSALWFVSEHPVCWEPPTRPALNA